jgi:serine/threonine protein kinase
MAAFQDKLRLYIVMEYVACGELLQRLQDQRRFNNEEARFYGAEILVVLEYLHSHRIAYRDLKPENILLDTLGHIRLVDYGYARTVSDDGRCGSFCGSPYYLAPELLSKGFYDGRTADVWSLGVLIYEMLVGKPPFLGKSMRSVYSRILLDEPKFPSFLDDDAVDMLKMMLHKNTKLRLSNLEQVKHHPWFKNIDWELVATRQIVPPYQPAYTGDNDTSNYTNFDATLEEFFLPPRNPEREALIPRDSVYEGYSS